MIVSDSRSIRFADTLYNKNSVILCLTLKIKIKILNWLFSDLTSLADKPYANIYQKNAFQVLAVLEL